MVVSESLNPTKALITYSIRDDKDRKVCVSDTTQTTVEVENNLNVRDEARDEYYSSDEMTLGYDKDVYISDERGESQLETFAQEDVTEDMGTYGGNHLYVKAIERMMKMEPRQMDSYLKQSKTSSSEDKTITRGNHLYDQAIERMSRLESRQLESYLKQYKDPNLRPRSSVCSESDVTVMAGSRLYEQAIERLKRHESRIQEATKPKSSKTSSNEDKTITRGNHLYDQAIERMIRLESRQLESYLKQNKDPNVRPRSSVCSESDVTVMAGSRLYEQAIERLKRHESRIQEETTKKVRSFRNLVLPTQTRLGKKLLPGYCQVPSFKKRHDHLYAKASTKIEEGRMRRTAIEEARARAKRIPETKILPLSQACDMYNRSMKRLIERNYRLEKLAEILYPESSFESMCTDYSEY